ncbi:hypothetical protein AB0451_18435 [Streptomyces sp. NPDC052000]|uniref:hypothetical protein n=1 Tax=Streptomyces sp. NPDC052000 TaxID=3155676 RepID=UPI00344CE66B
MAVGEDWQRDVLRELNAGGSAEPDAQPHAGGSTDPDAQPHAGGPVESTGQPHAGGPTHPDAQPHAGNSAAPAGQPYAGNPVAPTGQPYAGPAEGTFRIPRAEPRGASASASASQEPRSDSPAAGMGDPVTDPRQHPASPHPGTAAPATAHAADSRQGQPSQHTNHPAPTPGPPHPDQRWTVPGAPRTDPHPAPAPASPRPGTAGPHDARADGGLRPASPQPSSPAGHGVLQPAPGIDAIAAARDASLYGASEGRPATLPELRVPGGRDAAVPMAAPESVPTVDPRLAVALGKAVHGDSATKRAGRTVRKLTSSAAQDVAEETRIGRELQQPVTTGRVIAVTSIRGGVGKTTVAALLARSFNHYRHDPVLALEADGALGTLPVRLGVESVRWSCADLAQLLTPAMQLTDVTGYLVPVADGGWLLPASQGRLGAPLSMQTYRTVTLALRRYFAVTVVDCETLPGEVARTAMDTAHARIVVAPMTAEGVGSTRVVLDWLGRLPHGALATTVVALTANSPDMTLDLKAATAHLREAGVTVLPVPYDRHLAQGGPIQTALLGRATRQAAVSLAAEAMERAVRVR